MMESSLFQCLLEHTRYVTIFPVLVHEASKEGELGNSCVPKGSQVRLINNVIPVLQDRTNRKDADGNQ